MVVPRVWRLLVAGRAASTDRGAAERDTVSIVCQQRCATAQVQWARRLRPVRWRPHDDRRWCGRDSRHHPHWHRARRHRARFAPRLRDGALREGRTPRGRVHEHPARRRCHVAVGGPGPATDSAGFRYHHVRRRSRRHPRGGHASRVELRRQLSTQRVQYLLAPNGDDRNEGGAYLQDEIFLTDRFRWIVGGRLDKFSSIDGAVFSPRTTLLFKPASAHTFRASFNRAFRSPSLVNNSLDITIVTPVTLPVRGTVCLSDTRRG